MKKIDQIILKIFLYGLPVAISLAIFSSCYTNKTIYEQPSLIQALYNFTGFIFGLWMAFSFYLSLRLVFSKQLRSEILPKLTFFKERDEREAQMSGQAARNSYLITLAILICFLCLSVFSVSIYRVSPENAINGKTGTIGLGFTLNLFPKNVEAGPDKIAINYFTYSGLPVTNTAIILFLILWQILSYNYFIRRNCSQI
jgi:hypothetical protein